MVVLDSSSESDFFTNGAACCCSSGGSKQLNVGLDTYTSMLKSEFLPIK